MHGPFSWRKLIGNKGVPVIPEPPDPCPPCENGGPMSITCDNAGAVTTYRVCYNGPSNCENPPDNPNFCQQNPPTCFEYEMRYDCDDDEGPCPCIHPCVPGFACYEEPPLRVGCPRERLVEVGLFCDRKFFSTSTQEQPVNWARNPCLGVIDSNEEYITQQNQPAPYYFLPSDLPDAAGLTVSSSLLCLNYSSATQTYRSLHLIAGRNRDRYGGPICAYYRKGYFPGGSSEEPWETHIYGLTHIGHEQSSISRGTGVGQSRFGGTFPMEDDVLQLPLFGANERRLHTSNPKCPPSPCCEGDSPPGQACFVCGTRYVPGLPEGVTPDDCDGGYGHFLPKTEGPTAGYFSFSCFNPQSYLTNERLLDRWVRNRIEFPTSSLWAYIKGIRNYIYNVERKYEFKENFLACQDGVGTCFGDGVTAFDINWVDGSNAGESWWINTDPGGTNAAGTSNVRLVLDELQRRVEKVKVYDNTNDSLMPSDYQLVTPNVFLWDKDAFLGGTAAERWKHIYTIGYSNILFDSGCTNTPYTYDPNTNEIVNAVHNQMIMVDETVHEVGINVAGASRLIGWASCAGSPVPGTYAEYLRLLRCDGRNWDDPVPNSGTVGEFGCTACRFDLSKGECNEPFWRGYSNSVTACGGPYPDYEPLCDPLTGNSLSVIDSIGFLYAKENGEWFSYPPPTDSYPVLVGGITGPEGTANGNSPVQGSVKKFAPLVCNGLLLSLPWGLRPSFGLCIRNDNKLQQWGGGDPIPGPTGTWLSRPSTIPGEIVDFGFCMGNRTYLSYPSQSIDVKDVSTSGFHCLAIKTNGDLYSWGLTSGAGGIDSAVSSTPPPGSGNFIAIDTAANVAFYYPQNSDPSIPLDDFLHTTTFVSGAVKNNGTLVTWGQNHYGQVDSRTNPPDNPWIIPSLTIFPRPSDVEFAAEGGCTAIFFGSFGAGAITNSPNTQTGEYQYKVKVWGLKPSVVGLPLEVGYLNVPNKGIQNIKKLVILDPFTCVALKHDGTLTGWGNFLLGDDFNPVGWDSMVYQGILNENDVSDVYQFRGGISSFVTTSFTMSPGIVDYGSGDGVIVRRNNGTIRAYWLNPAGVRYFANPCDLVSCP